MTRPSCPRAAICCALFFLLAGFLHASSELERHLRDAFQGKTLVLRAFYSGDHLRYDSSGLPVGGASPGDWTSDGFVLVKDIRFPHHRLTLEAERLLVIQLDGKEFQSLPEEKSDRRKLTIEADLDLDSLSPEQADAAMSRVFLTANDSLAAMVPEYWRPCVRAAALGNDQNFRFSPEFLAIPGVAVPESGAAPAGTSKHQDFDCRGMRQSSYGRGVHPTVIYLPNPEYSERARRAKLQGTVILTLVVNEEGLPVNVHIIRPLGLGLDEKALSCAQKYRFKPAEKDGQPVPMQIAVEVNFHLY